MRARDVCSALLVLLRAPRSESSGVLRAENVQWMAIVCTTTSDRAGQERFAQDVVSGTSATQRMFVNVASNAPDV